MAEVIQEFECPCCGGAISFDSTLQKLKCPFCETEFDADTLKDFTETKRDISADDMQWEPPKESDSTDGMNNLPVFICHSCGGEIVTDENTAATSCPFCGSPVVLSRRFSGALHPDYVIPFKLDKAAAKEGFKKHLTKKKLLPKVFKSEAHIDEIKGIYVPFWLFDADVDARLRYRATKTRMWSDSNYNYTETQHYLLTRSGSLGFAHIPVDGSSKMADDLMESLEPFDFSDVMDFKSAYLAGYFADKYDVSADESITRANERVKASTLDAFWETTIGYETATPEYSQINLHDGKTHYALYPVWLMNTTYKKENYTFAMNGQTGKFVGNLPMDRGAFWKYFGIIGAVAAGITFALCLLSLGL